MKLNMKTRDFTGSKNLFNPNIYNTVEMNT